MARLGDAKRRLDRLEVAHLSDENHVGILSQCRFERVRKGVSIRVQLALIHHTSLVRVKKLDGILDRDDVLVALAVDLVDHRGERRRLARPRGAGHENQAARLVRDLLDDGRQAELTEAENLVGDLAVNSGGCAALVEHVRAEAGKALDSERKIELEILLEAVLLRIGEHRVGELFCFGRRQRRQIERRELAIDPDLRRRIRRDVKIGATSLDHRLEQLMKRDLNHILFPHPGTLARFSTRTTQNSELRIQNSETQPPFSEF